MKRRHWPILDLMRFGAALLVLLGHARGLLFVGIDRVERPTFLIKAIYLASGLQHEGVVIFFVVSGFLIGGSLWQTFTSEIFEMRRYLINRFSRIYIVYVPAVALVALLNWTGFSLLADTRLYSERPLFPSGVDIGWTSDQVYCHLLAIQGIFCQPWGADPPLWSLGFEWVLYLTAPFAVYAIVGRDTVLRVAAALLAANIFYQSYTHNHDTLLFFLFWWGGCAACVISYRRGLPLGIALCGIVLAIVAVIVSRLKLLTPEVTDSLIASGLILVLSCQGLVTATFKARAIKTGASFSYSLYLIHLPVMIFIGATIEHFLEWPHRLVQPTLGKLGAFGALLALTVLIAALFAAVTERHTGDLRRTLNNLGHKTRLS